MKADFATARGDAANGIAQMKADVATAVDEARTAAGVALAAEKNTATQALSAQTASLKAELAELVASTDKDRKKFVADDAKAQQDAADAVGTMQADVQRALSTLDQGDDVLAQEKSRSQHDLAKLNAVRAGAWDEYVIDVEARIAAIIAAAQYEQALADLEGALQGSARMKAEWIRENLGEAAYRQYLEEKLATLEWGQDATAYLANVLPGTGALLDMATAVTGEDLNGNEVGGGDRALAGVFAIASVAGVGLADDVVDVGRVGGKTGKRTANLADKVGDIGGGVRKAPTSGLSTAPVRIAQKLSREASDVLRSEARDIWQTTTGRRAIWDELQVHHRIPLEWSHQFGRANPNRLSNLVGIDSAAHTQVTNAWRAWKRGLNGRIPSQAEIMEQTLRIDEIFSGSWVFPK
jgi:hypothetical protein